MTTRLTTHPLRTERRERAAQRSLARSTRSVEDQLQIIADRPGRSFREVSMLTGGEFGDAAEALAALRNG